MTLAARLRWKILADVRKRLARGEVVRFTAPRVYCGGAGRWCEVVETFTCVGVRRGALLYDTHDGPWPKALTERVVVLPPEADGP
jgi:hypothetical protein